MSGWVNGLGLGWVVKGRGVWVWNSKGLKRTLMRNFSHKKPFTYNPILNFFQKTS